MNELNYNFVSLLDTVGFIQGMTLGILLVLLNKKRHKSTFFLGLFLIFFALKLLHYIFGGLNIPEVYPDLYLVPFNFSWLLFSVFFIYSQKISIFSEKKTKYWVLVPGIISFLAQSIIFFLPFETKETIAQSFLHEFIFTYLGIFYSWAIGIWNLRFLRDHQIEVNNYFSMVESRELGWAQIFLIYSLISSVIIHIMYYISPNNFYYRIVFAVFDLIAIYWVSFHGVQQYNVHRLLGQKEIKELIKVKSAENPKSELLSETYLKELMEQINDFMMNSEMFTYTELTIADLAEKLKVHPRRISTAINTLTGHNFNTYVNQFRIKKAKALLKKQEGLDLSIEGIGNEVGFNSKSAFYSAFKRETGLTPTKFLDSV
nr:helix-turn-helix domain-containing protein [Allomuricauda sp.]